MESLWSWIELQISTEAVDSETLEMDLNTKLKMNLNANGETIIQKSENGRDRLKRCFGS